MSFKRRGKVSRRRSRRLFSHTAGHSRVHPKNMMHSMPMRGGIRL